MTSPEVAVLTPEQIGGLVHDAVVKAFDARLPGLEQRIREERARKADAAQLVTRQEAADMLRLSTRELGRLVKSGGVPQGTLQRWQNSHRDPLVVKRRGSRNVRVFDRKHAERKRAEHQPAISRPATAH